jgi:ribosomal peptide maturation radical SAM protein 1
MPSGQVVLVSMPWAYLEMPSIALGLLSQVLRDAGIAPRVWPLNLRFMEWLRVHAPEGEPPFSLGDYRAIASATATGVGDWVFSLPPFRAPDAEADVRYREWLAREEALPERLLERLEHLRAQVPGFIDACVEELLAQRPAVVGFSSTFNQNVPSLLLARAIKARAPEVKVVFGGANCDGPMGQGLLDAFEFVDVVVRGEAEGVIVALMRELLAGQTPTPRPGVLVREGPTGDRGEGAKQGPKEGAKEGPKVRMDDVPVPDYGFFFEELQRLGFAEELITSVKLPVETARGCWWGQKQHCTFCGLNGSSMAFRAKSVEHALRGFETLAERHQWLDFIAVDNIIDLGYLRELLPQLEERGLDLRIFYETKANLTRQQVRDMRAAGIHRIQPGIESLSTPILKLMRKGVTAWQNVRLLKWCAQYDVRVSWNILYGFPEEPEAEYPRMAAAARALTHLEPPHLSRLHVQRFSPYHQTPERFGLKLGGPLFHYAHVYPQRGERLEALAYDFEYAYLDGREPETYVAQLRRTVETWNRVHERDRGRLTWRRGPGFVRIVDEREAAGYASYLLEGPQAEVYLACDEGASVAQVHERVRERGHLDVGSGEVETFLRELVEAGLMFEADQRFVSLALRERPGLPE